VWIFKGRLHVIPLSCSSTTDTKRPPRSRLNQPDDDYWDEGIENGPYVASKDAIAFLQDTSIETTLPEAEEIIQKRIEG